MKTNPQPDSETVTQLLADWRSGSRAALDRLTPLVYDELRELARKYMGSERPDHTLQPTAVVHEAFARMIDLEVSWQDRAHFFAVAARLMRRILVDHARHLARKKRGGDITVLPLHTGLATTDDRDVDLLDIDRTLLKLEEFDSRKSNVLELHYFGGLKYHEIAETLSISEATVDRELRIAKAWVMSEMEA